MAVQEKETNTLMWEQMNWTHWKLNGCKRDKEVMAYVLKQTGMLGVLETFHSFLITTTAIHETLLLLCF